MVRRRSCAVSNHEATLGPASFETRRRRCSSGLRVHQVRLRVETMPKAPPLRLGVNVDHVATLRNARGGARPDPMRAALAAIAAGADGITAHLREDRRHIRDEDMTRLKAEISKPLNFEMAATDDMLRISLATKPHAACLVPERREELTTEGGLDVAGQHNVLQPFIARLNDAGRRVSLFIG